MHQINPTDAQRIDRRDDERGLYVGLHRGVWPLYPNACNGNCNQGRACDCVGDIATAEDDEPEISSGVFVWPAVGALCIFAVLLAVHFWPR